jgi:hypothetical protein
MLYVIFLICVSFSISTQAMQLCDYDDFVNQSSCKEEKKMLALAHKNCAFGDRLRVQCMAQQPVNNVICCIPWQTDQAMYDKEDHNVDFFVRFAMLPEDMRNTIINDYIFSGDEEATQIFNEKPYGQALLRLARVTHGKKNDIGCITLGQSYRASRDLFNIYAKLDAGGDAELSLEDEQIIRQEMPSEIINMLIDHRTRCQRPMAKSVLMSLKSGLRPGTLSAVSAHFTAYALHGALSMYDPNVSNIIVEVGNILPLQNMMPNVLRLPCAIASAVHCVAEVHYLIADHIYDFIDRKRVHWSSALVAASAASGILGLPLAVAVGDMHTMYTTTAAHMDAMNIYPIIGGIVGGIDGMRESVYHRSSNKYPIIKTIADIVSYAPGFDTQEDPL